MINNTSRTMETVKDWLEQTLGWLHKDGTNTIPLQPPYEHLLQLMRQAMEKGEINNVWAYIDKIEKLTSHMSNIYEQGEAFIRCAKMAADLEDSKIALRLLHAAEIKFKAYPHQHAITLWMIGCFHWIFREHVDAIATWEDAIILFKDKKISVESDAQRAQWYEEKIILLEKALEAAIDREGLPAYVEIIRRIANPASDTPSDPKPASSPNLKADRDLQDSLRWMFCPVTDTVSAGRFGPIGFNPEPIAYPEFKEAVIDDETYQVYSVHHAQGQQRQVSVLFHDGYVMMRVIGNSMNASQPVHIENGDYILVHQRSTADDHEIVVAQIIGEDNRATVKRLKRYDGKILLVPESNDPNFHKLNWEREFDDFDIGFKILGVVKAVLKKKKV